MIISKTPLRVSLVGGSTDTQAFLDKYGEGKVISFPINLCTYIIVNKRRGYEHRVVYSETENIAKDSRRIKNDIVREVFNELDRRKINFPCLEIIFESDIPSHGSGLASSSSYTLGLLSAIFKLLEIKTSTLELCQLVVEIERKFNPLTGYQDAFGCGFPYLKKMEFNRNGFSHIEPLPEKILTDYTMYLIPTNKTRSSTSILNTLDLEKCVIQLHLVNIIEHHIKSNARDLMFELINFAWEEKKRTSPAIMDDDLKLQEKSLFVHPQVKSIRLCGAGGGGYFFVICSGESTTLASLGYKIIINNSGIITNEV